MASSTDCQFMDGPFHFNIEAESQSRWQVQGKMRRRDSDEFLFTYFITPQLMVSELLATSVLVLEICKEKGWDSTEIQNLNDACANLSYFHKGKSVEK